MSYESPRDSSSNTYMLHLARYSELPGIVHTRGNCDRQDCYSRRRVPIARRYNRILVPAAYPPVHAINGADLPINNQSEPNLPACGLSKLQYDASRSPPY